MRKFFTEIYLRWQEPLNTWWRRAAVIFVSIGGICAMITDFLPAILHDEFVPDSYKTALRMVYSAALFGATLAKLTTSNYPALKRKKNDALEEEDHG